MSKKRKRPKKQPPLTGEQRYLVKKQVRRIADNQFAGQKDQIVDEVAEAAILAAAVAAYDVCGLTGEALAEFSRKFLLQFDCIIAETVALDDLRALLALEAGTKLEDLTSLRDDEKPVLIGGGAYRVICWQGERLSISGWAEKFGIRPQTVRSRLARGWDIERALTAPVKGDQK